MKTWKQLVEKVVSAGGTHKITNPHNNTGVAFEELEYKKRSLKRYSGGAILRNEKNLALDILLVMRVKDAFDYMGF